MDEQYPQSNVHPTPGHSGGGKAWLWILLVIVLVVGAAGGVYYLQQQQAKKQKAELQSQIDDLKAQVAAAEKKAKEAENTDETKDWKSYSSHIEKLSFKYPSSWTIAAGADAPQNKSDFESITFIAPKSKVDGKEYQFTLSVTINDKPKFPNSGQWTNYFVNVVDKSLYSRKLYSVVAGAIDPETAPSHNKAGFIMIGDENYQTGQMQGKDIAINSQEKSGRKIIFEGTYVDSGDVLTYFAPEKFKDLPEVKTTQKIFSTISDK